MTALSCTGDLTELHLDAAQMGVGGVHSWGAKPDTSHLLPPNHRYRLSFTLRPFDEPTAEGGFEPSRGASATSLRELAAEAIEADGAAHLTDAFRCAFPGDDAKPFVTGGPRGRGMDAASAWLDGDASAAAGEDERLPGGVARRRRGRFGKPGKRGGRGKRGGGRGGGAASVAPG